MDDDVGAAQGLRVGGGHVGPAQHHRAAWHGLAQQRLGVAVHHAGLVLPLARGNGRPRLEHDAHKVVIQRQRLLWPPRAAQMQQRQTGLRRHGHGHAVRHLQAMCACELFLRQKMRGQPPQPRLLMRQQPRQKAVAQQRGPPKIVRNGRWLPQPAKPGGQPCKPMGHERQNAGKRGNGNPGRCERRARLQEGWRAAKGRRKRPPRTFLRRTRARLCLQKSSESAQRWHAWSQRCCRGLFHLPACVPAIRNTPLWQARI